MEPGQGRGSNDPVPAVGGEPGQLCLESLSQDPRDHWDCSPWQVLWGEELVLRAFSGVSGSLFSLGSGITSRPVAKHKL